MALRSEPRFTNPVDSSIAIEFSFITAILVGIYLWQRAVMASVSLITDTVPPFGGLTIGALVPGGLFLAGLVIFTIAYTGYREIALGLRTPSRADLSVSGWVIVIPVVLVGLTKLVGTLTGVPYNSLTMSSIAADAALRPVLFVTGLGLLIGVPTLVVVCQGLIQGSFERVVGRDGAIAMTMVVAGFALASDTGGLAAVPDRGKLIGIVLFTIALGIWAYSTENFASELLRYLAIIPVIVIGALIVFSGIAEITSIAGALFAVTHVVVFGIAAYGYDRSNSLVVPALAYASLMVANRVVVVVFEAGMQNW